jgi:nucleotide-binding universal stress UspA family protein
MSNRVLIALDSSQGAWRAVEYVAKTYGPCPGAEVTLLHVLSGLPPAFWDDGHILSEAEREPRTRMIAGWQKEQEKQWNALVDRAKKHLKDAGMAAGAVTGKFQPKYFDVAEDILNEARTGNFNTVVMGRRGLGKATSLLLGSVTAKVVQAAKGCAVTIVE